MTENLRISFDCSVVEVVACQLEFLRSRQSSVLEGSLKTQLEVEPTGDSMHAPCDCCGNQNRCVWGFIHTPRYTLAAYYVHWTVGRMTDHGANFDVIIGRWGDGATAADRHLIALEYRVMDTGPAFMVIDAAGRPADDPGMVGRALARAQVIGTPDAKQVFEVVDAILAQDPRLAELVG